MRQFLMVLFAGLLLSGCATEYQSSGLTGGFGKIPGPGKMEKVYFSGNGYIKAQQVQAYALYRAAEIAKSKNKPYFLIYQTLGQAAQDIPAKEPIVGVVDNKPFAYSFVLYLDESRPGALQTETVLKDLDPIVHPREIPDSKEAQ